jgi:hypothetical protein
MLVEEFNVDTDFFEHDVGSSDRLNNASDGSEEPRGVLK